MQCPGHGVYAIPISLDVVGAGALPLLRAGAAALPRSQSQAVVGTSPQLAASPSNSAARFRASVPASTAQSPSSAALRGVGSPFGSVAGVRSPTSTALRPLSHAHSFRRDDSQPPAPIGVSASLTSPSASGTPHGRSPASSPARSGGVSALSAARLYPVSSPALSTAGAVVASPTVRGHLKALWGDTFSAAS